MMTPEQIDALPEYTDAQLLKFYKHVRHQILSGGQALAHNGRALTRADLGKVEAIIADYEQRVAAEAPADGGNPLGIGAALVTFGRPL